MESITIEKRRTALPDTSEEIYADIALQLVDESIYNQAIVELTPPMLLMKIIDELPGKDQIEEILRQFNPHQVLYINRVFSTWVQETNKLLGCDNPLTTEQFRGLSNRWHDETDYLSSPSEITNNDAYFEIVSLGESVIPLILKDLQERGGHWYRALRVLSKEDPVLSEARGKIQRMNDAWLNWGRDKGYI